MTNWYDNIPTPVDKNGSVVPLDTRELVFMGERREVFCYEYIPDNKRWFVQFVDSRVPSEVYKCSLPDSWERLEQDAVKDPCEYFGMDRTSNCNECPAKSSETDTDVCYRTMTRDLVRRAKALAGVSDDD